MGGNGEGMGEQFTCKAHRVAVISDTHGMLRPGVLELLETCEVILHAGDIGTRETLERLNAVARTYAVRGNVDGEWAGTLPEELETELFGFRIYMTHNKRHIPQELSGVDIVIFGHSHKYEKGVCGGTLYLNPGSCGPRRFRLPVSLMLLTLCPGEARVRVEKIDCLCPETPESAPQYGSKSLTDRDLHRLVKNVMRAVDGGKTVDGIAAAHHVDKEMVEQICRMYVTHPGVDVDGILDRMELFSAVRGRGSGTS